MTISTAAYMTVIGALAAFFVFLFVRAIERENGLSFQTNWGGLGGALGGWRISRPAVYLACSGVLLAMLAGAESIWAGTANTNQFLPLAAKYARAVAVAQQSGVEDVALSAAGSKLHLTGIAADQNATYAVWNEIKQISTNYTDIWVDFRLAMKPAPQAAVDAGKKTDKK